MQNGQKHGVYTRIMKQKCIMQTQFDFQVGDSSSTLGAFRLWFDFQNRFNFGSGMQTGAPCPQHLPARRICSPGQPPDGQMCLLGAYFAKSLFSEHKIDVVTRIKFWKQPKSTKVHKKAPPGMPEALKFIRLSNRFDFRPTLPAGAKVHAMPGGWSGGVLLACIALSPLLAGLQDIVLDALPCALRIIADLRAVLFCGPYCDTVPTLIIFDAGAGVCC